MQTFPSSLCLVLAALMLGGCASMSENECRRADWYDRGVRDGAYGYESDRVAAHAEACSKVGVVPDRKAYFDGREQGLKRYCTESNGFDAGRYGQNYGGVCVGRGEADFQRGYQRGRQLAQLEADRKRLIEEIEQLEKQWKQTTRESERNLIRQRILLREDERMRLDREIRYDGR
ncbi:hypothetical protein HNQ59_003023 [Chitinivorax tropicus]|uniref:DUF2799 domain-containing protein n=1 Tax=Chitinivorax tropicus TaxID=714531 RepID=A0A840MQL0_9PROT|nr:DUF2799 domain-containing protein [Chitinivorax tropicus]MBB5019715.1 hypothetical protein [Chitinivorax tropicus]